jgi:hypothetical protein
MRTSSKKSQLLTVCLTSLALISGFLTPSFATSVDGVLRQSVLATDPVIGSLVPCVYATQLDCIEKLLVEKADGSIQQAEKIVTEYQDLPKFLDQVNQPSYSIFQFNSGKKNGPLQRVKIYSTLQTPSYVPDATGWGVQQGKRWGVLWIYLDRVPLQNEQPFAKQSCDGINISTCLLDAVFNPDDIFHLFVRTSWLKPVGTGGSVANYELNYRKIAGGTQWRFSGSEHLSAGFLDSKNFSESLKPENQSMKTDFFNPTLYFVVDHAGKDQSESFWDSSCADRGFTATMINAPLAGQPYWDYQKETLVFNIFGPHLTPIGTLNKGFFQAIFHKAWLDCRFPGNTLSTAAELKIAIIDQAGVPQIAVTNVKMKNEIVEIFASGFHYSSPRVEVARKGDKTTTFKSKASGYSDYWEEMITAKKMTITCVRGKLKKQVTAEKPICPTGFKKISKP